MAFDSQRVYAVWMRLINDEALFRALLAGTHRELAASRGFDSEELAILDHFQQEPGTRWNIENLRFRSALETADTLRSYLPMTVRLLTRDDSDWLQDVSFEYLAYHDWRAFGHLRLSECQRFSEYVRERIMKRRIAPAHLEPVLSFELAVVDLLKSTSGIGAGEWPAGGSLTDGQLTEARPRRSPALKMVELPVDIREWVISGDPTQGTVHERPVTFMVHVPSLQETHRVKAIGDGVREILGRCEGDRTVAAIVAELETEFDVAGASVVRLISQWVTERVVSV